MLYNSRLSNKKSKEVYHLLQVTLEQDFLVFSNVEYRKPSGLTMGKPLFPLLADIYVDGFVKKYIFRNSQYTRGILVCKR